MARYLTSRLVLMLIGLAVAACVSSTPPTPPPTPTPVTIEQTPEVVVTVDAAITTTPAPTLTAEGTLTPIEIKRGIQQAVDLYARAYNENKLDLLKQAVDQTNLPFRRLVQTRFEDFQKSFLQGQYDFDFTVADVQPREHSFVLAHLTTSGGGVTDWLFRQVDDRWVLSEPTVEQVGKVKQVETDHFIFNTYPWAADINAKVIELMENARKRVIDRLGKAPDDKALVDIMPIYSLRPGDDPSAAAYYDERSRNADQDRILIYAPHSYLFGYYDPAQGWESDLEDVLTHEYTHLVHNRSFDNAGKLADWMVEGLAEYVSGAASEYELYEAIKNDHIIPIVDRESSIMQRQDLGHMYTLKDDVSLAYALAHSLVVYIDQKYGGLDAFWKLARAYDKHQDMDEALRDAFDVSYEEFDAGWRKWLKQLFQ
jgi:hypothetical protein